MIKNQEEAIERLNKLKSRNILYGNRAGMIIEDFKTLQNDIETVLSMLKEKDKEIENNKKSLNNLENELNRLSERNLELFEESFEAQKKNEYWESKIKQGKKEVKGLKLYEIGIVCEDCIKEYIERKSEE